MNWPTFSLTALLDWLDEAAGGLIRLAYLAAGVTAVAVYFGAGQLPASVDAAFNSALPWVLAFALETHTYLSARRVRAAWQDRDTGALRVNVGVLVILLAFSAWNQLGYLSGVWQPPHAGPLALPTWLAYAVRALIVPAAFMAAAFLAPLAPPITAQIEGEARATLADVFKIARKQRRAMLKEAQAAGRDMTGALVELVSDAETRRIISHAYNAIRTPDASQTAHRATLQGQQPVLPGGADASIGAQKPPKAPDDEPPSGRSSTATVASKQPHTMGSNVTPLRRGMGKAPRRDKRVTSRANAKSGRRGSAEARVRAALAAAPTISPEELATQADVSSSTVSKWLAVIEAERAAQQTQAR